MQREFLSTADAAAVLGVHEQRVYQLIRTGALPVERIGSRLVLRQADVRDLALRDRPSGRPLGPRAAFGALALASEALASEPERPAAPWLSAAERSRLRRRLRAGGLSALLPRLRARSERADYLVHDVDLERLAADPRLVRSGESAAVEFDLDLIGPPRFEAYVLRRDSGAVVGEHQLVSSPGDASNVLLRVIDGVEPFRPDQRVAPIAAVAVDLVESSDARVHLAGQRLLASIDDALING